jgi:hypothetical protein
MELPPHGLDHLIVEQLVELELDDAGAPMRVGVTAAEHDDPIAGRGTVGACAQSLPNAERIEDRALIVAGSIRARRSGRNLANGTPAHARAPR